MIGFNRGRWWITGGMLAGMPSLFWPRFGQMQNIYGILLLFIGLIFLRRSHLWFRRSLFLTVLNLLVLGIAPNTFLAESALGLWLLGSLTTLAYYGLIKGSQQSLISSGWHGAAYTLQRSLTIMLITHFLYIILVSWCGYSWWGILPLAAQFYILVLLWFSGRQRSELS